MLLWLDLTALGFPFTALFPEIVGFVLVFCGLKLRMLAHGLGVLPVQHLRKSLAHTQHIRVLAQIYYNSVLSRKLGYNNSCGNL